MAGSRVETDSMGAMELPAEALYGASTQRAVLNFQVSGQRFPVLFLRSLGLIKFASAQTNARLGRLEPALAKLISAAAQEMMEGKLDEHFPLDIFQTGSGTSTNMNANEVLANRCSQMAGEALGSKRPAHPNDHVNMGQSSNDVIPTGLHVAAARGLVELLLPALAHLQGSLQTKTEAFWDVVKIGRTHLMDATPIRLGQEFSGYAKQIELARERLSYVLNGLLELPLGGTAVGTGINTHLDFARGAIAIIAERTGIAFREAANHFEAQSAKDALLQTSGTLKTIAITLHKIANDIRLMGSGPRCGFGELQLPAVQPGSSIMPGKTNPVMVEMLLQVCARVIGNDVTVSWAAAGGQLELNAMMPVMGHALLESISLLTNGVRLFADKCVDGLTANAARCLELVDRSMAMVTSLVPHIGYDRAAAIAKRCMASGLTVRQVCLDEQVLPPVDLDRILDPLSMTRPQET